VIEGLQSFQNIFKVPELKRRVLMTLLLLAAYRLGAHVPTPGIDAAALAEFFNQVQGTLLGMVDLFSGGNLRRLTVFALGIMPYISASIILQLLTVVIPALEKMQKEGEVGRRKITQYTRYATVGLSFFQAFAISAALEAQPGSARLPFRAQRAEGVEGAPGFALRRGPLPGGGESVGEVEPRAGRLERSAALLVQLGRRFELARRGGRVTAAAEQRAVRRRN